MIISGRFWRKAIVDDGCRDRLRVALRSHRARLEVRRRGWRRSATRRRCPRPARASRSAPPPTAKGIVTASGVPVQSGIAAADPQLLPVGSVVEIDVAAAEVQRHLHDHGYRARRAGPPGRHLHVELPRGAAVRAAADSPDGAAPGMEPEGDDAELPRPVLQAPREPAPLPSRPLPLPGCQSAAQRPRVVASGREPAHAPTSDFPAPHCPCTAARTA